jgi:hypothetical protein
VTNNNAPGLRPEASRGNRSAPNSTAPDNGDTGPVEPASPVPVRDKLLWGWDDIAALTGLSRRLLEQQVSARRMPGPDIRVGRRALWRPATITVWLESLAQQAPGRRGRA